MYEEEQLFSVLAEEITAPIGIDLPCRTKQLLTKPEVRNVSHPRDRTEPRPQSTYTENLVKIGRMATEICGRTDRKTDRQTDILITVPRALPGGGRK